MSFLKLKYQTTCSLYPIISPGCPRKLPKTSVRWTAILDLLSTLWRHQPANNEAYTLSVRRISALQALIPELSKGAQIIEWNTSTLYNGGCSTFYMSFSLNVSEHLRQSLMDHISKDLPSWFASLFETIYEPLNSKQAFIKHI